MRSRVVNVARIFLVARASDRTQTFARDQLREPLHPRHSLDADVPHDRETPTGAQDLQGLLLETGEPPQNGRDQARSERHIVDLGVRPADPVTYATVILILIVVAALASLCERFAELARRLGIQYVIWNKRIWGSYAAGGGWRR